MSNVTDKLLSHNITHLTTVGELNTQHFMQLATDCIVRCTILLTNSSASYSDIIGKSDILSVTIKQKCTVSAFWLLK